MRFLICLCACYLVQVLAASHCRAQVKPDYTFVVIGDDRVDAKDTTGNPATINLQNFKRILNDIALEKITPRYLFVNGDLVYGHTNAADTARLAKELTEWIKVYEASPLPARGVKLVAIPGNHETCDGEQPQQKAIAGNEAVFVRVMNNYIAGNNGPHATGLVPGTDSLTTDQSRLTYSFNYGGNHFVILNTDAVGRESRVAWHWLKQDLDTTRKKYLHTFVFGHKPPYSPVPKSEVAMENYKANRDSMWAAIEKNNVDFYFGSHFHMWDTVHPHGNKTYEVICGNAGANTYAADKGGWINPYYGYTIVAIYNTTVRIISKGFDIDEANYTYPFTTPTIVKAHFAIDKAP